MTHLAGAIICLLLLTDVIQGQTSSPATQTDQQHAHPLHDCYCLVQPGHGQDHDCHKLQLTVACCCWFQMLHPGLDMLRRSFQR